MAWIAGPGGMAAKGDDEGSMVSRSLRLPFDTKILIIIVCVLGLMWLR